MRLRACRPRPGSALYDYIVRELAPTDHEADEASINIVCEPLCVPGGAGVRRTVTLRLKAGTTTEEARAIAGSLQARVKGLCHLGMGAALAYYTMFSLAPLLLIVVSVSGLVFGEDAARGEIQAQLQDLMGDRGAGAVQGLLASVREPAEGLTATAVGLLLVLVGATTVFAELQDALDRIWRIPGRLRKSGWLTLVCARLMAFGMILAVGFLLVAFMFGLICKVMPRQRVLVADVWLGALLAALLFTGGKYVIGAYIGRSGVASGFGAAGSLVVVLLWVYFSAQILLVGAEFTCVYARTFGSLASAPAAPDARSSR